MLKVNKTTRNCVRAYITRNRLNINGLHFIIKITSLLPKCFSQNFINKLVDIALDNYDKAFTKNCASKLIRHTNLSVLILERPKSRGRPSKFYHPSVPKEIAESICPKAQVSHTFTVYLKPQLGMRPILSATGTYNLKLTKWFDEKLKLLSIHQQIHRFGPFKVCCAVA